MTAGVLLCGGDSEERVKWVFLPTWDVCPLLKLHPLECTPLASSGTRRACLSHTHSTLSLTPGGGVTSGAQLWGGDSEEEEEEDLSVGQKVLSFWKRRFCP